MPRFALIIVGLCLAVSLYGCRTESVEMETHAGQPVNQQHDFDEVKKRAKQLKVGMRSVDVLILLGSPAKKETNAWVYLPSRTGAIIPAEALQVNFERGRYVSHVYQPIVGAERIIFD